MWSMTWLWFLPSSTIRRTVAGSPIGMFGISVFLPSMTAYEPGLVSLSSEGLGGDCSALASESASFRATDFTGPLSFFEARSVAHPARRMSVAAVKYGRTRAVVIAVSLRIKRRDGDDTDRKR